MDKKVPNHLVMIPDGNRRWAQQKGLPSFEGHRKGAENFIQLSKKAFSMGVRVFTLWAFSTENWKRTTDEVGNLMSLFDHMMDSQIQTIIKNKISIVHLGRKDRLSKNLANKILQAEEATKDFKDNYLVFGLDYGGRDEIVRAINSIKKGGPVTETDIAQHLDTKNLPFPDPDLIIRTSGEQRTSGFMPWQSVYAEYLFVNIFFPDFSTNDLEKAITDYSERHRRFGL